MNVRVRLFARARDLAGAEFVEVSLSEPALVSDLRRELLARHPALTPLGPTLLVAIDNQYARDDAVVGPTSDVACFPPVSGG